MTRFWSKIPGDHTFQLQIVWFKQKNYLKSTLFVCAKHQERTFLLEHKLFSSCAQQEFLPPNFLKFSAENYLQKFFAVAIYLHNCPSISTKRVLPIIFNKSSVIKGSFQRRHTVPNILPNMWMCLFSISIWWDILMQAPKFGQSFIRYFDSGKNSLTTS